MPIKFLIGIFAALFFDSCSSIPKGVNAVRPFDKEKYLGKWYEIARKDFRFERGLNNTTANYSLDDKGGIKVVNRGFNYKKGIWKQASGKAKFANEKDIAMLKVSFFGPFYAGYNVIALDSAYQYALISGDSRDYLWILAREKKIPENIRAEYLKIANENGFNTTDPIWVEHDR